jgi:hypothetical protein
MLRASDKIDSTDDRHFNLLNPDELDFSWGAASLMLGLMQAAIFFLSR